MIKPGKIGILVVVNGKPLWRSIPAPTLEDRRQRKRNKRRAR